MVMGWGAFNLGIPVESKTMTPEEISEAQRKREREMEIEKEGRGICVHCGEEIFKNENMPGGGWTWESETMVGWCDVPRDHKHKPKLTWTSQDGVQNA